MFGLEKKTSSGPQSVSLPWTFFFFLLDKKQLNLKQAELRK